MRAVETSDTMFKKSEGRRQKLKAKSKGKDRRQRSKAEGIQSIAKVEGKGKAKG